VRSLVWYYLFVLLGMSKTEQPTRTAAHTHQQIQHPQQQIHHPQQQIQTQQQVQPQPQQFYTHPTQTQWTQPSATSSYTYL
jgi:hypothetical protein